MPRPRLDHDEQRERIARAACEVILEIGLENARLSEIATHAGVTTGAVQHYFRNKEDLLFFAKNHVFDIAMKRTGDAMENQEGAERLFTIIRKYLPVSGEQVKAARLLETFRGRAVGNANMLRAQHKRDARFLEMLVQEIGLLKEKGLTRTDLDVGASALGLNAMLDGLGAIVMASPGSFKAMDLFGIVENYVCEAMGLARPRQEQPARKKQA